MKRKGLTVTYDFSYPETEGDALMVEVQDKKKSIQGRATIPISSLADNPVIIPPLIFSMMSLIEIKAAFNCRH